MIIMSIFKKRHTDRNTEGAKSKGLRLTEKLLPIFGPAQVGDSTTPIRPPSQDEDAREQALETELVRKVGPDGQTYLVENRPS